MTPIVDPSKLPAPRPRRAPLAAAALALLVAMAATPAQAQTLNVSALVTGSPQTPPLVIQSVTPVPCGAACQYAVTSSTGASTAYAIDAGPYTANAWPPAYAANMSIGTVQEVLTVPAAPAGVVQDGGGVIGVQRRAAVEYDWQPLLSGARLMSVQTWKGGSGASTVSITIRVTPTATKAHYMAFTVPKLARGWQEANYIGGPSGSQQTYTLPRQLQTRSAVDVYADGLPIWSGESNMLRPQRWSPPYTTYLDLQWGPALDESEVKFYLGNLTAGVTRTIALVFRTDQRVNADTCYTDNDNGTTYQRCDSRREALTLPSVLVTGGSAPYFFFSYRPDVRVYTY